MSSSLFLPARSAPLRPRALAAFPDACSGCAQVKRGYTVRACVRDPSDPTRSEHLLAMNAVGVPSLHTGRSTEPGKVELWAGDVTKAGSYDEAFAGCSAVIHVGTPMGYGGANDFKEIFYGAVEGTQNDSLALFHMVNVPVAAARYAERARLCEEVGHGEAVRVHLVVRRGRLPADAGVPAARGLHVLGEGLRLGRPRERPELELYVEQLSLRLPLFESRRRLKEATAQSTRTAIRSSRRRRLGRASARSATSPTPCARPHRSSNPCLRTWIMEGRSSALWFSSAAAEGCCADGAGGRCATGRR